MASNEYREPVTAPMMIVCRSLLIVGSPVRLLDVGGGVVLAGPERDLGAEAEVVVGGAVEGVLQPLAGDVEAELLQRVGEQVGADEARDRPGGVVDLRVVLRHDLPVAAQPGRGLVVGGP